MRLPFEPLLPLVLTQSYAPNIRPHAPANVSFDKWPLARILNCCNISDGPLANSSVSLLVSSATDVATEAGMTPL